MLRALRTAQGMTAKELGRHALVDPATISRAETGRLVPYEKQLKRLAETLGWTRGPELLLEDAVLTPGAAVLKRDIDDASD